MDRLGNELCDEDFESYTGESLWTSDLDYVEVFPSEEVWNDGERNVICVLPHTELNSLDSLSGSWATPVETAAQRLTVATSG